MSMKPYFFSSSVPYNIWVRSNDFDPKVASGESGSNVPPYWLNGEAYHNAWQYDDQYQGACTQTFYGDTIFWQK